MICKFLKHLKNKVRYKITVNLSPNGKKLMSINNSNYNKMENINQTIQPNDKKSTNDFIKLAIGIFVFIIVIVALKYLVSALGII